MKKDLKIEIMKSVKLRAKQVGITQSHLAKRLGVSLPTVKRWYSSGGLTIDALEGLCNELDFPLVDLFASIAEQTSKTFEYSKEQEEYFSRNPDSLAFFDNLLRGYTAAHVQRKFAIPDSKVTKYLSQLDKLSLIEWQTGNRVKILVRGEPSWRRGGSLATKLRTEIFESFLRSEDQASSHFFLHDYLEEDRIIILQKVDELIGTMKRANSRAKNRPEKTTPFGAYISLQKFRWSLDNYLKSK